MELVSGLLGLGSHMGLERFTPYPQTCAVGLLLVYERMEPLSQLGLSRQDGQQTEMEVRQRHSPDLQGGDWFLEMAI